MSIREGKYDAIQTALLYLRGGIAQILGIGSQLRYTSVPAMVDPLDIPPKSYVDGAIKGTTVPFLTTNTWPLQYNTTTVSLVQYFGSIPTLIVRETVSSGVYKYRTDIQPVYDSNANTLTIDVVPFNGDITFKT